MKRRSRVDVKLAAEVLATAATPSDVASRLDVSRAWVYHYVTTLSTTQLLDIRAAARRHWLNSTKQLSMTEPPPSAPWALTYRGIDRLIQTRKENNR